MVDSMTSFGAQPQKNFAYTVGRAPARFGAKPPQKSSRTFATATFSSAAIAVAVALAIGSCGTFAAVTSHPRSAVFTAVTFATFGRRTNTAVTSYAIAAITTAVAFAICKCLNRQSQGTTKYKNQS